VAKSSAPKFLSGFDSVSSVSSVVAKAQVGLNWADRPNFPKGFLKLGGGDSEDDRRQQGKSPVVPNKS
jgi:hypothetical protein